MDESNVNFYNGLLFDSVSSSIPREILAHILSYVDPVSLVFQCRTVCKNWRDIIDQDVWKILIRFKKVRSLDKLSRKERMQLNLPWYVYYMIFTNDPFDKNLIRNNCGQEKMTNWEFQNVISLEHCWVVEPKPNLAQALPNNEDFEGHQCCFATFLAGDKKSQVIELEKFGFLDKFMDEFQPIITAKDWYAGEYGHRCRYKFSVKLLGIDKTVITKKYSQQVRFLEQDLSEWDKFQFTFSNYGPGVRYVKFEHGGEYHDFERYCCMKTAGAVVKVSLTLSNLDKM